MPTLPPAYCDGRSLGADPTAANDAVVRALFTAAANAPSLIALFHRHSRRLAFLNSSGRSWLLPDEESDPSLLTLDEILVLGDAEQLEGTILLRAEFFGAWRGACKLRDTWGSEIPVFASLGLHPSTGSHSEAWISLHAVQSAGSGNPEYLHTDDSELLHALLETLPDAVYFKDRHSRFLRVSRSLATKDGLDDPSLLVGKTDFDRFTAEHSRQAYDDEQNIIATGVPLIEREEKETWPDGRITWVSTSKFPLRDRNGATIGTFGVSRDISAHKAAEAKALELEVQLQLAQKLESIGRLSAGVAHEINTPTQFISDNTRFLTDSFPELFKLVAAHRSLRETIHSGADASQIRTALAAAEAAVDRDEVDFLVDEIPRTLEQTLEGLGRIARIVRSLKEFSHPNSPEPKPSDLNRIIETTVTVSRHEWKYVAEVVTELAPDLPPVPCVVDSFNQVMLNLIVNAAHAIAENTARRAPGTLGRITVRTRREDEHAVIEVADTGAGIPPAVQARIFDPFFTTKEVGKGTGQGLAIVHTVVAKHHGGSIDFTTTPGEGTTFRVRLPLSRPAATS